VYDIALYIAEWIVPRMTEKYIYPSMIWYHGYMPAILLALAQKFTDLLSRVPRVYLLPLGVALFGIILFGYGLIQFALSESSRGNTIQPEDFTTQHDLAPLPVQTVMIDIAGGVITPGVYTLPLGSRVADAILAAGGLAPDASARWISSSLNQAAVLKDGQKLYIPTAQETDRAGESVIYTPSTTLISLNTATQKELESLPGIGPVTAQKIMQARPYGALDELLKRKIVSSSVYGQIESLVGL